MTTNVKSLTAVALDLWLVTAGVMFAGVLRADPGIDEALIVSREGDTFQVEAVGRFIPGLYEAEDEDDLEALAGLERPRLAPNPHGYDESRVTPDMFSTPPVSAEATDGDRMSRDAQAFSYTGRMTRNFVAVTSLEARSPPDHHIAAGPNHIVTIVNGRIRAFPKNATQASDAVLDAKLARFFCTDGASGCPTRPRPFDPKIIYDPDTRRFFAIALGRIQNCVSFQSFWYIAASSSSDPSQPWIQYHRQIELNGEWGDYPSLGMGDRGVYISLNYLPGNCGCCTPPCPPNPTTCPGWTGTRTVNAFWILDKSALVAGASVTTRRFLDLRDEANNQFQTFRVTVTYGSPPSGFDAFLLAFNNVSGSRKATVWGITVPPTFPSGTVTLTRGSVTIPTPPSLVLAGQRGGPGLIQTWTMGGPPYEAVYRNNRIWTSTHSGANVTPERTALRFFEINVSSWPTLSLQSTGSFWDGRSFYYYPGLTANRYGDVAMVFSFSRATAGADSGQFPGSRWTMRLKDEIDLLNSQWLAPGEHYFGNQATDQAGVCTGGICTAGTNIGSACTQSFNCTMQYRWGDYAGITVDPIDQGFWMFHQYSITHPTNANRGIWAGQVGYVPRAVFVDGVYPGIQAGSRPRPYNTVELGHLSALDGNDLVIRAGNYPETLTLSKAVTIIADGGTATIGQ